MSTSSGNKPAHQGFTLVEVLVALVILSVGILGLEALGIYAVRATAQADRNSRAAAVATLYLEDALQLIRADSIPRTCTNRLLPNGDRVTRTVQMNATATQPAVVTVSLTPASRGRTQRAYTIVGYAYAPPPATRPASAKTSLCP